MMNNNWIDISVSLRENMVIWPDSKGFSLSEDACIGVNSEANVSSVNMDLHCGTHIDAPLHFIKNGERVETIDLSILIGECYVLDCQNEPEISVALIERIPKNVCRILFKTKNSGLWSNPNHVFRESYVALTLEAAKCIVERNILLTGVDYLSVQCYNDNFDTHRVLLSKPVVLLESINLEGVQEGYYELYCLPLKIIGTEAAPCRALIRKI